MPKEPTIPAGFLQKYCGGELQPCLQGIYNLFLGVALAIAFLMIVIGAFQYMLGEAANTKQAGREKITNALTGVLIIFLSGVVLYWINPNIFNARLIVYKIKEGGLTPPEFDIKTIGGVGPDAVNVISGDGGSVPVGRGSRAACNRGTPIGKININNKDYTVMATKYYITTESQGRWPPWVRPPNTFEGDVKMQGSGYCDLGHYWICPGSLGKYARYTGRIAAQPSDACGKTPLEGKTVAVPQELHPRALILNGVAYLGTDSGSAIVMCENPPVVRIDFFSGRGWGKFNSFSFPSGTFVLGNKLSCP